MTPSASIVRKSENTNSRKSNNRKGCLMVTWIIQLEKLGKQKEEFERLFGLRESGIRCNKQGESAACSPGASAFM